MAGLPKKTTMFDSAEVWPTLNEEEERSLQQALKLLSDRPQDEAIRRIKELEAQHVGRLRYPWKKLGLSPMATALEPLAQLARLCATNPGAPSPEAFAAYYAADGWRVDAAAVATMAACETQELHDATSGTLQSHLFAVARSDFSSSSAARQRQWELNLEAHQTDADISGKTRLVCRRTPYGRRPTDSQQASDRRD